jgi:peptidoglycan-associated lipoprotein
MKNSMLVIAVACSLALITGCGSKERVSILPNMSVAGTGNRSTSSRPTDLSTNPLAAEQAPQQTASVNSTVMPELPDYNNLADREMDRAEFKAQTVYFAFDQAQAKSEDASKIEQVAGAFKAKPAGFDLLIEGHCDERGTEEYNRSLGERRALAIRELLVKSGIDGQRIYTKTLGKDQPAIVGHDEAAWSQNRRGEFILVLPKKIITTQNTK